MCDDRENCECRKWLMDTRLFPSLSVFSLDKYLMSWSNKLILNFETVSYVLCLPAQRSVLINPTH